MRLIGGLLLASAISISFFACTGDDPVLVDTTDQPDAQSGADAPAGETGAGDTGVCTPGCSDANTLRACSPQTDTPCALGCVATGTAHCAVVQPSAPVVPEDLSANGVSDLAITASGFMNTDDGSIPGIRTANTTPGNYEVISGIGFKLFAASHVGVFTVKSFAINDSTSLMISGTNALAIAAATTITLQGVLDVRAYGPTGIICNAVTTTSQDSGGAGGRAGGNSSDGPGVGGGHAGDIGGGGGGGFGGPGAMGGHSTADTFVGASAGGIASAFPTFIAGGFGGGSGSGSNVGGGSGGGVELVAGQEIKIGGGTKAGGVNVGGCGGLGGAASITGQGGGGGGSGGAILLQSPAVTMLAMGVLAANGGPGGSGGGRGNAGNLSDVPAAPIPLTGSQQGAGGAGSGGANLTGGVGAVCTTNPTGCFAGGGGGGAGQIHIENAAGALTLAAGAIVSPSLTTAAVKVAKVASK